MADKIMDALYKVVVDDGPVKIFCVATPANAGCHGTCCVPQYKDTRCFSCFPDDESCDEASSRGWVYNGSNFTRHYMRDKC